jgi:hypothetical protein
MHFSFVLVIFLLFSSLNATASLITIEANGQAHFINEELKPFVNINDLMTISFEIELGADDLIGDENWFQHNRNMNFSLGSYAGSVPLYRGGTTDGPRMITLSDGSLYCICWDVWAVEGKNDYGSTFDFPELGDFYLDIVHLEYRDNQADAISTRSVVESLDHLQQFEQGWVAFYFKKHGDLSDQRYSVRSSFPNININVATEISEPPLLFIIFMSLIFILLNRGNSHTIK